MKFVSLVTYEISCCLLGEFLFLELLTLPFEKTETIIPSPQSSSLSSRYRTLSLPVEILRSLALKREEGR